MRVYPANTDLDQRQSPATEHNGIILGKALGGGLPPVSAFLARAEVIDVFTPRDHG